MDGRGGNETDMHRDTLRTLVRAHQGEIFRYMRYLGADASLADDLVQDTFVAAFSSPRPPDIDDVGGRAAWLRAVARNLFLNACRRRRTSPVEVNSERLKQAEAVWASRLLRGGDGFDTVEALRKCLARLTAKHREMLDLRYKQGKSRAEMARRCKMTGNGIKTLLRRIRAALADCIQRRLATENRR